MRRRAVVASLLASAGLAGCSSFVPEGATKPVATTREIFLEKINEVRAANGVGKLHYDVRLEAAARRQAELMVAQDKIAHELGESLRSRVSAAGYHQAVAENLAGGQKTLEAAIEGWLDSPAHRAAMLDSKFTEVGFAVMVKPDSKWKIFWATIYGGATANFFKDPGT